MLWRRTFTKKRRNKIQINNSLKNNGAINASIVPPVLVFLAEEILLVFSKDLIYTLWRYTFSHEHKNRNLNDLIELSIYVHVCVIALDVLKPPYMQCIAFNS